MGANREALELAVLAGEIMLKNGAEVFRAQETILRILASFGAPDANVYVISNAIFVSAGDAGGAPYSAVRHVPLGGVHLGRVAAVNEISREIAAGQRDIPALRERLKNCEAIPNNHPALQLLACSMGAACFCYILGGSFRDSAASFLTGLTLQCLLYLCNRQRLSKFIVQILGGGWITLFSGLLFTAGLGASLDFMIIGPILPLVPGVLLTTAIRDYFNGDYLSGTIHLTDALLSAACIAVGVSATLGAPNLFLGVAP